MRYILASSSIRFFLLWSLPAVSIMTMSQFLAFAAFIVSKTTAAGSAPSECFTISTPALSAQIWSWSIAAARNVSAAPKMTFLPSDLYIAANLPMVVVLPTPLTPITNMMDGMVISPISSPPYSFSATISLISSLTIVGFLIFFSGTRLRSSSIISSEVCTPTSCITSSSSSSV